MTRSSRTRKRGRDPRPTVPRWLRPRLAADQVRDLSLAHHVNLDAIAKGEAGEDILWQVAGGTLTWCRVAELLGVGQPEMAEQLQLLEQLVARFHRTGRVLYTGSEYQLAKRGVEVMDALASSVDRDTAIAAANWGESTMNTMAARGHIDTRKAV